MLFDEAEIRSGVERLLTAHGVYRHLDWLVECGRLAPGDLVAWRDGESPARLADLLYGDPLAIGAELGAAAAHAERLGLAPMAEPAGGAAGDPPGLPQGWAQSAWRRPEAPQLDLFFDSGGATRAHVLREALAGHDADAAETALAELERFDPGHALVAAAPQLIAALRGLPEDPACAWSAMETAAALAGSSLGDRTGAFLAELWRGLARRLDADDASPIHASAAWARVPDWRATAASLGSDPGAVTDPELLARGVRARRELGETQTAARWFCQLCWRWPELSGEIEHLADRVLGLASALESWDERDLAEGWGWQAFPSWLLLRGDLRPELAGEMPGAPPAFVALGDLLARPDDIAARQRLKEAAPEILQAFLARI